MQQYSPYNSLNHIELRPPATNSCILSLAKKMGTRIPFTTPTESISTNFVKNDFPSKIGDTNFFNNVRFTCEAYNTITEFLYLIAALSQVYWTLAFPFLFCVGIVTDLVSPDGAEYYFLTLTPTPLNTTFIGLFLLAYIISSFWKAILRQKIKVPGLGAEKFFEFNRQTGMVTRFEKNKILYCYPLIDFDCFLMTRFTNKGFPRYSLELYPRYENTKKSIPLSNLLSEDYTDSTEYLRLWNTIQCYMDTSHPLPDISILEEFRAKDLVTKNYDQKNGRNSHYWREMSDDEYSEKIMQIEYAQKNSEPLGEPVSFEFIEEASTT